MRWILGFLAAGALGVMVGCVGDEPSPASCPGPGCPGDDAGPGANASFEITTVDVTPLVLGSSAAVGIGIARKSFDGPITITASGLPAGVSAAPLVVSAGAADGTLTLAATGDAQQGPAEITIAASDASGELRSEKKAALVVRGRPGEPDLTFGQGGAVTLNVNASVSGVVVQPDGKTLVSGTVSKDFVVLRLGVDGAPDASFGNTGQARTDFYFDGGLTDDTATGLALAPDGRVLLAGYTITTGGSRYALARYRANGAADTEFDGKGYTFTQYAPRPDWSGDLVAWAVTAMPDGRPVIAGTVYDPEAGGRRMVMARFKSNGRLEDNAEFFGVFPSARVGTDDVCHAVAATADKIVCAGTSDSAGGTRMVAWRVDEDGTNDTSFHAGDGVAVVAAGALPNGSARSVHVLPQGRVLLTGTSSAGGMTRKAAVVLLTANGALDGSFGGTGAVSFDWGELLGGDARSSLDAEGRVTVVAAARAADNAIGLARLLPSGQLDASFGDGGKRLLSFAAGEKGGRDVFVAHHPDGRVVIATAVEVDRVAGTKVHVRRVWQ
ncbi:MAG: hypothetical protein KIS78_15095 [Labilithrix sp.]|nr:hypothetical protein [Labilithrix sp.]